MFFGDVLQALYVVLLDHGRATLAGFFDGLSDVTQVLSIGGGAATAFHHRIDMVTFTAFGLIVAGSVGGAAVGNRLSKKFTQKPLISQSAIGG